MLNILTMNKMYKQPLHTSQSLFGAGYFLCDGGLETTLIFHHHFDLPHFASFELVNTREGREALRTYYESYLKLAQKYDLSYILETPTWRASSDWGFKMGYTNAQLNGINRTAALFLREIQHSSKEKNITIIISGAVGPRGDGYTSCGYMTPIEAAAYHSEQIRTFALADVDVITAMTLNYSDEAVGIVMAARSVGIPVVISFTVETDGKLPNGETLESAILRVDAETASYAEHFMINCAHPEHFKNVLKENGDWKNRIRGIRANASTKSHEELNESTTLDTGDKCGLARNYVLIKEILPDFRIVGGCCGTDHTHLEEVCHHLFPERPMRLTG